MSSPASHDPADTAKFSAVVTAWERQFGARVVAAGFATLHLGVTLPPRTEEEALQVAAEPLRALSGQCLARQPTVHTCRLRRVDHRSEQLGLPVGLTRPRPGDGHRA
ncbi:DUF4253 domain-containing protein [Streptodolium elevatio]|uniref:DUF4253 domain-containing protein n=1 Tax=Streptodolium elevatio TaxID=3157996 RepID=A0ABV3DUF1_9ACTN